MDAQIVLRKIAAAAVNFVGLRHAAGDDFDARVERQTIAFGAGKFEADPVAAGDAVIAQNHGRAIDVADDYIHVAIVEQIADRQAARDALFQSAGPA